MADAHSTDASIRTVVATCFRMDPNEAAELARELQIRHLAGGAWLMRQGDPGDSLFLLVRGRLQVWREAEGDAPPTLIGEVAQGESVGEVGLLTGEPRSASIRAIRDSTLLEIDRERFEDLTKRHPALALELAGLVARRLHERTVGRNRHARDPKVIALRPIDPDPGLARTCAQIARALERHGSVLELAPDALAERGAPTLATPHAEPDEGLRHWISDAEDRFDRLVLRCDAEATPWSRFACRQADLIVHVTHAGGDRHVRDIEIEGEDPSDPQQLTRHALVLVHPAGAAIDGTARWISRRRLEYHLHLRADRHEADLARIARVLAGCATGLVLGGGAARGFAHLGVYRAMVECGVPVDWVGGTSIGAILGAGIAKDLDPLEAIERARVAFVDGRPFDDYTIPLVSVLRGGRMVNLSKEHLAGDVEDLPLPFFCVSSNMNSGLMNIHQTGQIWRAISASAALPGVLPPVVHEAELAVDGAVLNNLPIDVMLDRPVGTVFAVELSTREALRVDYDDVPSPWTLLRQRLLPWGPRDEVPGLATLLLQATGIGSRARTRELGQYADLLLRPPVADFSLLSIGQFDQVVDAGYRDALEAIGAWQTRQQD